VRLSGSCDAGRSWEVPVCLAHGLVESGHPLAATPAEADLILWATGAVDLDLSVLPGDYALLDKIARCTSLIAEAPGAALAVLLPEGPQRAEAEAALRDLGRDVRLLPSDSVPAALAGLAAPQRPQQARRAMAAVRGAAGGLVPDGSGRGRRAGIPRPGSRRVPRAPRRGSRSPTTRVAPARPDRETTPSRPQGPRQRVTMLGSCRPGRG